MSRKQTEGRTLAADVKARALAVARQLAEGGLVAVGPEPAAGATPEGAKPAAAPEAPSEHINRRQVRAKLATIGTVASAEVIDAFRPPHGVAGHIAELSNELRQAGDRVNGGDLGGAELMLMSQAIALDSVFANLATRASQNLGHYPEVVDRYLRLALKAQGQCRATLETLAAIKNGPVVFARQANINHGGQQQVNNGTAPAPGASRQDAAPPPAPGKHETQPNELLGGAHGE